MINVLTSNSVSYEILSQLREWFVSEWGDVEPFEGVHSEVEIPSPIVAVDERTALLGGLSFTSATKPNQTEIGVWINMVLISPSHRNKGIASMLVQSAEVEAKNSSLCELFVLSEFPNLYRKLGWELVEVNSAEKEVVLKKCL